MMEAVEGNGADGRKGAEGEVVNAEKEVFETLVTEYGVPMCLTVQTAEADSLFTGPEDAPETVGSAAVVGLMLGGLSAVALSDDPQVAVDKGHMWLVSFAVTAKALDEMIGVLQETAGWLKERREDTDGGDGEAAAAGEAEGDGGVVDDPDPAA